MHPQSQVHIIHATSSPGPENFSHYRINQAVLGPAGLGETALPYHHDRPPDVLDPSTAGRTWPTRGHDVNRYQPALNPIPSGALVRKRFAQGGSERVIGYPPALIHRPASGTRCEALVSAVAKRQSTLPVAVAG